MKKTFLAIAACVSVMSADQLIKLNIQGMMCPACVSNVKTSLNSVQGVKETTVFLKSGTAEVKADNATKPAALCDAVKQAGYECSVAK
ncbi:MAG: heavy-metal-associated domain-containing protein [Sulfurovaceae bacterium]